MDVDCGYVQGEYSQRIRLVTFRFNHDFTVFADTGLLADAVTFGVIIVSESDLSLPDLTYELRF